MSAIRRVMLVGLFVIEKVQFADRKSRREVEGVGL